MNSEKAREISEGTYSLQKIESVLDALSKDSGIDLETCKVLFVDFVNNGIELFDGLLKGEGKDLMASLHQFKGSSGNFRVTTLMKLAQEVEQAKKSGDDQRTIELCKIILGQLKAYQINNFTKGS